MKHFTQIYFNKSRNQHNLIRNSRLNGFSSVPSFKGVTDSTINENYKQFAMKQMNMQIDTKMLGLIAKMNDGKIFETMKSQFDEDKKILLAKTLKNLSHSNSDYSLNNHLNLKNFHSQLNRNYTYDAADNLLIISFFDRIKNRKRKVYKLKQNHYINILFQGTSSPKKNKKFAQKENTKFDYKLLLKNNSDLDVYLKNKDYNLNIKKVSFKDSFIKEKEVLNKSNEEKNKIEKINRILNNKEFMKKRRKSLERDVPFNINKTGLNIINEENKSVKSSTNLPNIKDRNKIIEKNCNNEKNLKSTNDFSSEKNKIKPEQKTITISRNKEPIKMKHLKNNIIKKTQVSKEEEKIKSKSKEKESKVQLNEKRKDISKTLNNYFWKNNISPLKIKLSENEKFQCIKKIHKQKFNKIISVFNEKEKKIEKKYTKINKLITDLKNKEKTIKSADREQSPKRDKKLIDQKKVDSPKKTPRLLYKEWNEINGLFHFPLINRVIYKNKKNQDNIDIIKSNLRKEYIVKLKRNRKEYSRKIDGKKIIKKLNDRFEIERLIEYSEDLREKQRKKEQLEYVDINNF